MTGEGSYFTQLGDDVFLTDQSSISLGGGAYFTTSLLLPYCSLPRLRVVEGKRLYLKESSKIELGQGSKLVVNAQTSLAGCTISLGARATFFINTHIDISVR